MSHPTRLIPIAGRELEVQHIASPRASGIAKPPTIVLLHEALGSVSHWRDFPRQLAQRCAMNVLVYSRPGHGHSEGPPEPRSRRYFEQQAVEVLPALLEHFGIQHPVLLGHSEGAAIALIYTANHQATATHQPGTEAQPAQLSPASPRALILESPILLLEPAAAKGMALAERTYRDTDFRERLARHHRDVDAVFSAWLSIRESDSLLHAPLEQHLPTVRTPVLLLQGERDEYATALQAEALRPLAPNMRFVSLPAIGHTPHREQPEQVLDTIASFLDALPEPLSGAE
jgi:pimeloyl-ACP methyl ester carboxylesterase